MSTRAPQTVLLVEDAHDDELLTLRALRRSGKALDVRVARDGLEALKTLGLDHEGSEDERWVPDLIVSDFKLPRMRGDEVLARVRAEETLQNVPYVVFSSSDEQRDVERCLELGASEYAPKPVDYDGYMSQAQGIAQRWLDEI